MATLLIVMVLVLVGLALWIARRPDHFHVERSALIPAPPEAVFAQINDFHHWHQWSPFARDPDMRVEYLGSASGEGALYRWAGNKEVGEGSATIVESRPGQLVRMQLEFLKPFRASSVATFQLRPEGAGTRVVWGLDGRNNFIAKAMGLLFDPDKMCGGAFEQGLEQLRARVTAAPEGVQIARM
ncbi:polyketide cyclase [Pseudomonas cavernae]|uniref:Polyketide cyclase n=1 Tax=Pseudomonas cavernae TaxID=2320867 RepID=A0A385Z7N3_9PSED|nr:SRPBCC family protein [Pseudomonas cavernae]AYC34814.1 polyketide cyclase [Pseudomonas cavernae]